MPGDLLQVRIPPGVTSGSSLTVQSADGRLFAVVVPEGLRPGDLLTVDIRDAAGGSTVVVAEAAVDPSALSRDSAGGGEGSSSKTALGAAAVGAVVGTILIGPITGSV